MALQPYQTSNYLLQEAWFHLNQAFQLPIEAYPGPFKIDDDALQKSQRIAAVLMEDYTIRLEDRMEALLILSYNQPDDEVAKQYVEEALQWCHILEQNEAAQCGGFPLKYNRRQLFQDHLKVIEDRITRQGQTESSWWLYDDYLYLDQAEKKSTKQRTGLISSRGGIRNRIRTWREKVSQQGREEFSAQQGEDRKKLGIVEGVGKKSKAKA